MQKRVIIVHGWDGTPEKAWFPWLKKELEAKGFEVIVPQLPDTGRPRIYNWVPKLAEVAGTPNENTYFVGHSMGNQTIARYLESLPEGIKVGGAVFVAGFFKHITNADNNQDETETRKHWLEAPLDLNKVRSRLSKSVAIFSDDDPYVPLDNQDDFRDRLNSKIVIEHAKGHFRNSDKCLELPSALEAVMSLQ